LRRFSVSGSLVHSPRGIRVRIGIAIIGIGIITIGIIVWKPIITAEINARTSIIAAAIPTMAAVIMPSMATIVPSMTSAVSPVASSSVTSGSSTAIGRLRLLRRRYNDQQKKEA
jgi:hypothetical protein